MTEGEVDEASELLRDLVITLRLANAHHRRREADGRASHVFVEQGRLHLRYWSFDDQQNRRAPIDDIVEIVDGGTGEVFASLDAWVADLRRAPRYKPDPVLTKRWYKVQSTAPLLRSLAAMDRRSQQEAEQLTDSYMRWRLTEGSRPPTTEPEIVALIERSMLEPFTPESREWCIDAIMSGSSKKQIAKFFECADAITALEPIGTNARAERVAAWRERLRPEAIEEYRRVLNEQLDAQLPYTPRKPSGE